jgi:hypothetical protein
VGAVREQDTELAVAAEGYTRRRLAEARAGRLGVLVDHADLLVVPPSQSDSKRGESA